MNYLYWFKTMTGLGGVPFPWNKSGGNDRTIRPAEKTSGGSCQKFDRRFSVIYSLLLSFALTLALLSPANAINITSPGDWTWVTSSPWNFTWNPYGGWSGTYLSTDLQIYHNFSLITNVSTGASNWWQGFGSESSAWNSYWRHRTYYRYQVWYQQWYTYTCWVPVYRCGWTWVVWCWSKWCCWLWTYTCWWEWQASTCWSWYWTYYWQYAYTAWNGWHYFAVDLNPPYFYGGRTPADGYQSCSNNTVTFSFSCTDAASGLNTGASYIQITKNTPGGTAVANLSPVNNGGNSRSYTFTSDGTFYWRVVIYDNVGRVATTSWWRLVIDIAPPTTMGLNSPLNNVWLTSNNVNFNWQASSDTGLGVRGYYLKVTKPDGSDYPGYGGTYGLYVGNTTSHTIFGMPNNTNATDSYRWYVTAEDNCFRKSGYYTGDNRFRIDSSVTTITINTPNQSPYWYNEYTAPSINFNTLFTDNVGVKQDMIRVWYYGWGGWWPVYWPAYGAPYRQFGWYWPGTSPHTINQNAAGIPPAPASTYCGWWYTISDAYDMAGNYSSAGRWFRVDTLAPTPGSRLYSVAGIDITATPANDANLVVGTGSPQLSWYAASDAHSGISKYYITVWDEWGTVKYTTTTLAGQTWCNAAGLTTGKYYWEVSVEDVAGNHQVYYTNTTGYNTKRYFFVDLDVPVVTASNPPSTNYSVTGAFKWVITTNPSYTGTVRDTYGISRYLIEVANSGFGILGTKNVTAATAAPPFPTNNTTYNIPSSTVVGLGGDGIYNFRITGWDRKLPAGNFAQTAWQTFNVDTRPPNAGALSSPVNDAWGLASKPTLTFTAANDNLGAPGYSDVHGYIIRVWWDNTYPNAVKPAAFPAAAPYYKDYGTVASPITGTSFTITDDLTDGRYYWDVYVIDRAGNWRWFYNATTGHVSTSGSPFGNTAKPANIFQAFRVDITPPTGNILVSEINDKWITSFKPAFTWKAGNDLLKADGVTPRAGSGNKEYQLYMWGAAGGSPAIYTISCGAAPGNTAFNGTIAVTPPYAAAWPAPVLGAGATQLSTGRYYWDIKLVDNAGNYTWFKSGVTNAMTTYTSGEKFRVDGIPPDPGTITWPKSNQWVDQSGTRFVDGSGIVTYNPNKKPVLKFTAARDLQSGLQKYRIILKDKNKVIRGEEVLTPNAAAGCTAAPDLFALAYGDAYIYNPPWGSGTWAVELKDGQYYWEVEAYDNTGMNRSYYANSGGNDNLYEKFRLDTVAPIVAAPGIGELVSPSYGYIATTSVNLVNFKWSRALDDVGTHFDGTKIPDDTTAARVGSGIHSYSYVLATNRDKLKNHTTVDLWESGYVITTSPVTLNLSYNPTVPDTIDNQLNSVSSANVYWSIYVRDYAGNESQYVDRKLRIRHIPPNPGNLIAPPHNTTTTNRRPKFIWTK